MKAFERARNYIALMTPSVQGACGSTAIFDVAQALMRGFDLSEDDAWPLLTEWNSLHATPPWSEKDLRHKLQDAARNSRKPAGYLLEGDRDPVKRTGVVERERMEKQKKREAWPKFHPLTEVSINRIAKLRGLAPVAVGAVNALGYLSGGEVEGHRSFILHERNFAQARRFDGEPYEFKGEPIKAKTLPGSEGMFFGWKSLGTECPILLIEGIVGYLEAYHAAFAVGADTGWAVLSSASSGNRFNNQELHRLRGRRIRIVPDNGKAGLEAAGLWAASLRNVGCDVDVWLLPDGAKDLGDVLQDTETLTGIFSL